MASRSWSVLGEAVRGMLILYAGLYNYADLHNLKIYIPMTVHTALHSRQPTHLAHLDLKHIDTLVFAGGGNRCIWQAGLVSQWLHAGWALPARMVGTSAGAGVATALLGGRVEQAIQVCQALYAANDRVVNMSAAWRGRIGFAHQHIYPAWMASYLNASNFETLRQARTRLTIAFARPSPWLGLHLSTLAGTLAYIVDKHISHSIHPRLPKWLGLRQGYMDLQDCTSLEQAQTLLSAAAAAPPLMQAKRLHGAYALDGGFVDNAPISASAQRQSADQKSRTLVLLTRFYPQWPTLFSWQGRQYLQPSQKVPVSTWDCTAKTVVSKAFDLGAQDAARLAPRLSFT
jgi:predicted patatin/cPLA2 family phospholipase